MLSQDSKTRIVKESIIGEIISITGDLFAGMIMVFFIMPFKSFSYLIIMIPALLTLRGNVSGTFIARTIRDLFTGELSKKLKPIKRWLENIGATLFISLLVGVFIGIVSQIVSLLLGNEIINLFIFLSIPLFTILFDLIISIPLSSFLNISCFRFGLDPNNLVNPIMTCVDDFLTVFGFFLSLILLGVP